MGIYFGNHMPEYLRITGIENNIKIKPEIGQFDRLGKLIKKYSSLVDASNKTNIHRCCIGKCVRNKQELAGGYLWKYVF